MNKATAFLILGLAASANVMVSVATHKSGFMTNPTQLAEQEKSMRTQAASIVGEGTRTPASSQTN